MGMGFVTKRGGSISVEFLPLKVHLRDFFLLSPRELEVAQKLHKPL